MFLITLFLLVFIISASVQCYDFDLWARLIAGMGVIDGHQVLKTDFLSYTPTHTWWDHEYGSGIVFYWFFKHFGPYSLIWLQTVLFFLMFFIISRIIKLRGSENPYNFLFYIFPIIALYENFAIPIRCHFFSFLLFTVFLYILEKSRKENNYKILYILPILTVVWNNLHGGVVAGLGLIAMYGIGEILEKRAFKHYVFSGVISFCLLIINPWGIEYVKFLLMATTMKRPSIIEWWGIFSRFHLWLQIPFKIFMCMMIGLEGIALFQKLKSCSGVSDFYKKLDQTKYIVLAVTLYLAIVHVKMLPFFVITGTVFCYEDFETYVLPKLPKYIGSLIGGMILFTCIFSIAVKKFEVPVGLNKYPHREVEFIKQNKIEGKILVNFGLGSFVSYKLYPQNRIFMDGRYEEVYYDDLIPMLDKFYTLKTGWDEVLRKYPPDVMIIEKNYAINSRLKMSSDWTAVYDKGIFTVFVPTKTVKKSYIEPTEDIEYYRKNLFKTSIKF